MAERERGVGRGLRPSMTDDVKAGSESEHPLLLVYKQCLLQSSLVIGPSIDG